MELPPTPPPWKREEQKREQDEQGWSKKQPLEAILFHAELLLMTGARIETI
jgi:hypothetical protein